RFLIARTAGAGSDRCVMAVLDAAYAGSPSGAFATGSPIVLRNAFGGSVGDWCQVRNVFSFGLSEAKPMKCSSEALSLRKSRSVFFVFRFIRSRNGRSPAGDAPCPLR